jgi:predicted nucleic acid-binding protein
MVRSAVFNSSPWIFLTKLGIVDPALSLFQQIYVPLSVSKEILSKPDESAGKMKELQKNRQVNVLKARSIRLVDALGNRLGRGEAEAIVIAIEMDADVVCLDDYPARSEAIRLGLEVKGTLGIIRRLMELDKFECNLEDLSENLKKINFRVSNKVFWEIFRDIDQK